MTQYTVFCRDRSDTGTTWIDSVEARDVADARERAVAACSFDWNYDPLRIVCIGVVEGDAKVLYWEDLSDGD